MENKQVGFLILGITAALLVIIFLFQNALKEIIAQSCDHGPQCVMYSSVTTQTILALTIVGILVAVALVLIFTKPKEKVIIKKIKEKKKKPNTSNLDKDEKKVIELLFKEGKAMFQSSLMEKLEIGKVKTTRLLDKLEAKQIIERKRRGMNNIVVLKD